MTPQTEAQLKTAHNLGLQRILSFECPGGGFGWYAGHGPNVILTAYAAMFLADLAKVAEVDRAILDRTVAWLEKNQDPQGRWSGSEGHSTWQRLSDAAVPSTAYVVWALRTAGREDSIAVGRALEYLRGADTGDPYALALVALASPTPANLDRLARMGKGGVWKTQLESWTRAAGSAADLEATALAVIALARHDPALADEGAAFLVRSKRSDGTWGSTQATVLALKALSAAGGGQRGPVAARLWVNGREIAGAFPEGNRPQSFDISPHLGAGANEVVLETTVRVNAQVTGRYYVPWGTGDLLHGVEGLNLQVLYDRTEAKVGDTVTCTVKVESAPAMVIAEVAVPPGFTVDRAELDDLVRRGVADKVAQTGRTLTFYLSGKGATFSYGLKPRYPVRVAVPRSVAYEYYTPDRRVVSPPQELVVEMR